MRYRRLLCRHVTMGGFSVVGQTRADNPNLAPPPPTSLLSFSAILQFLKQNSIIIHSFIRSIYCYLKEHSLCTLLCAQLEGSPAFIFGSGFGFGFGIRVGMVCLLSFRVPTCFLWFNFFSLYRFFFQIDFYRRLFVFNN